MRVPLGQYFKVRIGEEDHSLPTIDKLSSIGILCNSGYSFLGRYEVGSATGVLNIGSPISSDAFGVFSGDATHSLHVQNDKAALFDGDVKITNSKVGSTDVLYVDGDLYVTGAIDGGNKGRLASRFAAADASPKLFDIDHPTKGKGHRLAYACIEGPEVGVYYRGRLKDSNVIDLPDYWKGLVHSDSITVQLQPIGDRHFHLNVVSFDNEKIIIKEADDKPIDCFFHVYGERKDVNGLVTEYEGDSWKDHPQRRDNDDGGSKWKFDPNSTNHNTYTT